MKALILSSEQVTTLSNEEIGRMITNQGLAPDDPQRQTVIYHDNDVVVFCKPDMSGGNIEPRNYGDSQTWINLSSGFVCDYPEQLPEAAKVAIRNICNL